MCSSLQPKLRGGRKEGRQASKQREGRRNRLAPGVGSSQVKCLSGHVGMASKRRGRSERRSRLTHNRINRKLVRGEVNVERANVYVVLFFSLCLRNESPQSVGDGEITPSGLWLYCACRRSS